MLGVVEGDQDLHVLRFGRFDPGFGLGERVAVQRGVVGRDVARDLRVQLLPERVAEHVGLLIAESREVGVGGVGARSGRARKGAGADEPRGEQGRGERGEQAKSSSHAC